MTEIPLCVFSPKSNGERQFCKAFQRVLFKTKDKEISLEKIGYRFDATEKEMLAVLDSFPKMNQTEKNLIVKFYREIEKWKNIPTFPRKEL